MKPKSYRLQDGCWNCKTCISEYNGETTEYTCIYGDIKVPLTPHQIYDKVNLGEIKGGPSSMYLFNEWNEFSYNIERMVSAGGKCDHHEVDPTKLEVCGE